MRKYFFILLMSSFAFQNAGAQDSAPNILFFGESITAGYGIGENNAFPALINKKIDSLDWNYTVQNGGLSGETSAGGLRRIDWMIQNKVDVFILELGGNDGLRGISAESTRKNLQQIIDKVRKKYPRSSILITGMQVPPNLGSEYTQNFKDIYPSLAEENDISLIPLLLDDVGRESALMQADGIHPTAEGHQLIANKIWDTLKPILKEQKN